MLPDPIFRTQTFHFVDATFNARIPDPALLSIWYQQHPDPPPASHLFWARIWPSGLGLCQWLALHPEIVRNKTVLEIAGGLGLPSLLVAPKVKTITCTDINQQAVETVRQSAQLNGYENVITAIASWASVPDEWEADVLLLSDVNYEPAALADLKTLISRFLKKGSSVILSTPERIVARSFLEEWLPYQSKHESFPVEQETIHVYVLS